jgi:putative ABC transport system permease protein
MKYFPLVWSALWRKPAEAVLIWLAVTASFTLFGLMVGLHATYDQMIANSRMDRLDVNARFPAAKAVTQDGVPLLPVALRDWIARVDGVSAAGLYYELGGYYQDPHKRLRIMMVDANMRSAWTELPVTPAQWAQLFATRSGVLMSRSPAARLGLKEGDTFPLITGPGIRADGAPSWEFRVLAVVPDDPRQGSYTLGNFGYLDEARPAGQQGYTMGFRVAVRDPALGNAVSLGIDRGLINSSSPTMTIPDQANTANMVNSAISVSSRTWPVAGAGVFMILLLIANGVAQSVRERMPEFAMLQTLGYRPRMLMGLLFAEVAIPCVAGALVGLALAAALTRLPSTYLPSDLTSMPKPTFSWMVLAWVLGCALLLALASAVIPSGRLWHSSVTDALAGR